MAHQSEVLEHDADAPAEMRQGFAWRLGQLFAEQADPAARRPLREIEQLQQGGLPGAGRAGKEIEAAMSKAKVEVAQNLCARAITKPDTVEFGHFGQNCPPYPNCAWRSFRKTPRLAKHRLFLFTLRSISRKRPFVRMILTCPSCGTQYVVKDGAIPPQGRQVRCASCKHSWHQDPEASAEGETTADNEETVAEATLIEPRSGPEAEERAYEEAAAEDVTPDHQPQAEHFAESPAAVLESLPEQEPAAAAADWDAPPEAEPADDDFSPFAAADEVTPRRRNPILTI